MAAAAKPKKAVEAPAVPAAAQVDAAVVEPAVVLEMVAAGEATIEDEAPIAVVKPSEPTYVTPKVTRNVRIGPFWYSFSAGQRTSVPDHIVPHLQATGVI